MIRTIATITGLAAVAVGAVLIMPSFVDWNARRPVIASWLERASGRPIVIAGPLSMALLPTPVVTARDVRVLDRSGPGGRDLLRLSEIDIHVAPLALLGGRFKISNVTLVAPVLEVSRGSDGRIDWAFATPPVAPSSSTPAPTDPGASSGSASSGGVGSALPVAIERIDIRDGTLVMRDADGLRRIDRIDVSATLGETAGPMRLRGTMRAPGGLVAVSLDAGPWTAARIPLSLVLSASPPATPRLQVDLNGDLDLSGEAGRGSGEPRFAGRLRAVGDSLAAALALGGLGDAPGIAARGFSVESALALSADGLSLDGLALGFGEVRAAGSIKFVSGRLPELAVNIAVGRFDLDRFLAEPPRPAPKTAGAPERPVPPSAEQSPTPAERPPAGPWERSLSLPANLSGNIAIGADAVVWRGNVVREARLIGRLAEGAFTIDRLGGLLPGGADLSLRGSVTMPPQGPRLQGAVEGDADNLRAVFDWLGLALPNVPADRLRKLSLSGRIDAVPGRIDIAGLDVALDATRLTGAATLLLRDRLAIGARLAVDRLNLDAYLGLAAGRSADDGATAPTTGDRIGSAAPLAIVAPSMLGAIDLNLDAAVEALTVAGMSLDGTRASVALQRGDLTIHDLSVRDVAGASLKLVGLVSSIDRTPRAQLAFETHGSWLERLLRLAAPDLPVPALGGFSASGDIDGSVDSFRLDADIDALGGRWRIDGEGGAVQATTITLALMHPDASKLATLIDPGYRATGGPLGPLDLKTRIETAGGSVAVRDLDLTLGALRLSGEIGLALGGARPRFSGDISFNTLAIDRFMSLAPPVMRPGAAAPVLTRPGAGAVPAGPATSERWSRRPLDLSGLFAIDADLTLTGEALSGFGWHLERPRIVVSSDSTKIEVSRLTGTLFEGALVASGRVTRAAASPVVAIDAKAQLQGARLKGVLSDLAGVGRIDGTSDASMSLTTSGASPADLISALAGSAALSARDGLVTGVDLQAISDRLRDLNRAVDILALARSATGGVSRFTSLTGSFAVEAGVVRSTDLHLVGPAADGRASVVVDLPRWTTEDRVVFRLTDHPQSPPLAMIVEGSLDAPRKVFDINPLQQYLLQRGIDRLARPGVDGAGAASDPLAPLNDLRNLFRSVPRP